MKVVGLLLLVALASAEVIDVRYCDDVGSAKCPISEVRLTPCSNKKYCEIVKGNDAELSFDFTPQFTAEKLKTDVIYNNVEWDAVDPDGCKATTCPTEAGKPQTYSIKMHVGKKLPTNKYQFKWRLYDENDPSNMCCLVAGVKLVKK